LLFNNGSSTKEKMGVTAARGKQQQNPAAKSAGPQIKP
jgi:hypothetical protein